MKKRVLCFGDSNTWGYIAGSGKRYDEDTRWTGLCQKELGSEFVILEDGLNGRTTVYDDPVCPYKNGLTALGYTLTAQKPLDLVVLMLGTNDFKFTDALGSAAGIDEIVRTLLNADYIYRQSDPIFSGSPKILLVAPIAIGLSDLPEDEPIRRYGSTSVRLPALCRNIGETRGVPFLNAAEIAAPSPVDGIHLGPEGHAALGKVIAAEIRAILGDSLQ